MRGNRFFPMRDPRRRAAALLLLLPLAAGCGGRRRDEARPSGSALWLEPRPEAVTAEDHGALDAVGVREVFLEAARLRAGGTLGSELASAPTELGRRPVTLVLTGAWSPALAGTESKAQQLLEEVGQLLRSALGRGLQPQGVHFDLTVPREALPAYAEMLRVVGRGLERSTLISATVERSVLEDPGARELAGAVDYLVAFLYGQRPQEEDEDPTAWDFDVIRRRLDLLEGLGQEYLLGVSTVGRLLRLDETGRVLQVTSRGQLREVEQARGLSSHFSLDVPGVDRRRYDYQARARTRLSTLVLERGEVLRVSFLSRDHLVQLTERLAEQELPALRGAVYYRPPHPDESLSLTPGALAGALSGERSGPVLEARLEGSGSRFVLALANTGDESTEVGGVAGNYVELRLSRGSFERVEPGAFERYDLLDRRTRRRTLRQPGILRLYLTLLGAGQNVRSGAITVSGARLEDVEIGGEFNAPGSDRVAVTAAVEEAGTP